MEDNSTCELVTDILAEIVENYVKEQQRSDNYGKTSSDDTDKECR